jgi:hypothetical protein
VFLNCALAGYGFELYHVKDKDLVFSILKLKRMGVDFRKIISPLFYPERKESYERI